MRVHILDDYFDTLRTLPSFAKLEDHEVTVWTDKAADEDALVARLADAEVIVLFRERTAIDAGIAARLPAARLVAMRGIHPHVDVAALTEAGIVFCSQMRKDAPSSPTAELAFALMLSTARMLPEQIASARAGTWQAGVGRGLRGLTLGLYGYGGIAKLVAGHARAFGMDVVWWASEAGRARARADGEAVAESREAFFGGVDFVSVHKRLTPETRGEITRADLAAMRPDAVFVNTSRAELVAPGALLSALDAGRPGRAAVDVYDGEPITDPADPQIAHPAITPTPHIGFVTTDELDRQFSEIYDLVLAFAAGEPDAMVNPEAWTGPPR